jgi:hypothetical protein
LDHVLEFELNNSEKAMDGNKLVSNYVDCTDLSSVRSGYSASSKYVEGLEQVGLSVNGEKSEPVKADKGLEKSVVASKFAPNCSKLIQGSDLKTGSAHVLNPLKQSLGS